LSVYNEIIFMELVNDLTKFVFFTGKGGVGKTSLSCLAAITLAGIGKQVMLVCTDPASNLNETLGTIIGHSPTKVTGVNNLLAVNIDPEDAAYHYRERIVSPYRDTLPEAAIVSMEEQLSGACTMEIAAFDEFAGIMGDSSIAAGFDHIIFDTAPTGHTLRLLQLPSAWDNFLDTNTTGTSCLGPVAGLKQQHGLYKNTVETLMDEDQTTIFIVSRAEKTSLNEADRTSFELREIGIRNQKLIVNGLFQASSADPVAIALESKGIKALAQLPACLQSLQVIEVPLLPFSPVGLDRLLDFRDIFQGKTLAGSFENTVAFQSELPPPFAEFFPKMALPGKGLIMTMGKGGVGKTTLATEIALNLVAQGHKVHLATTDPAAHLDFTLGDRFDDLTVTCINPREETRAYQEKIMAEVGSQLDEGGKKLLAEDLRSPCTDEIAVFQAFARLVDLAEDGFVVLDTAPTGHTILLLDAAQAYHREVSRSMQDLPTAVRLLLPRLRDPVFTQILIITLPEATPVLEAAKLQQDLQRAGITPAAWIINQSLAPLSVSDSLLAAKRREEFQYISQVITQYSEHVFLEAWRDNG
jgi:arsenite-transporting ATPase